MIIYSDTRKLIIFHKAKRDYELTIFHMILVCLLIVYSMYKVHQIIFFYKIL